MENNNENNVSNETIPLAPPTVTIGQFNVPLGPNSVTATAGNATASQIPSGSGARVPTAAIPFPAPITHAEKPEKFNGLNFKRWQQKMMFYLTTIGLVRFLTEDPPKVSEDDTDIQARIAYNAWNDSDYFCHNFMMNCLTDSLYNVYSSKNTAKELWESLDKKYKTEDAGAKKYIVGRYLDFKMVDSKTVVSQVQELQLIFHEIHAEGMVISESFQVASVIEKLPSGWKDFKNYLKHKRKEMSLEDLIVRLRIEEDNRGSDKRVNTVAPKANVVEHGESSKSKKPSKSKNKLGPKGGVSKKTHKPSKFLGICYNCDKPGHKSADCKLPKRKKKNEAHAMDVDDDEFVAVVSEVNLVDSNPKEWWLDTGATRHVCSDRNAFSKLELHEQGEKLYMGNSATSEVKGKGTIFLKMTSGKELKLTNVLFVPDIRKNLISGSLLCTHGFKMVIESQKVILSKNGIFVGKGYVKDSMFKMNVIAIKNNDINKEKSSAYMLESSNLWHGRLGHVNFESLRRLIHLDHIPTFNINSKHKCETCVEAKQTRTSFKSVERSSEPLELIHSDLCDLKFAQTRGGNKYFVTFIDDSTKFCYVYLLKSKDEAIEKFAMYKNEVENQLNKKIKRVRSDRGGEYIEPFGALCAQYGIIHETTPPYSPQSNGVAERKNRTLKEMMNAMLISSGLPQGMWGEAILSANYLLNKVPRKTETKTPYELWFGRKPSYKYLKVWGCLAKVMAPTPKRMKIGPKTVDCVFIGYAQNSSAYRFLVYESKNPDIHKNTIMESRNASFFEHVFPYINKEHEPSSSRQVHEDIESQEQDEESVDDDELEEPRRSKRARVEKSFGPDFLTYMLEAEPQTYKEAVKSAESSLWKEAIKSEIDSILQNHTWELVDLPPGNKPLGSKWVFKRKMKPDGTIDKYKARLVIKGYRQKEGEDYFDTYSPVSRINSIRLILAIAALRNLEVHQMDVKTAFLNGDLEEEIYMEQPEGCVVPGQERKVCKLVKSLYGLKQAPKQWHEKFDSVMISNGFKINECDKCVYIKNTENGYVILCLYVDDMLIVGSNDRMVKSTKDMLNSRFDMKDMGLAEVILGIKITRTANGLILDQSHYVDKLLEKFSKDDNSIVRTPIDANHHLSKNKEEIISQVEYARVIGSLMYLMSCTRPDIAFTVSRLSRYTSNPGADHWKAIVRVLRYLRFTRNYGLHYTRYPEVLEGYSDASWISDINDSKATSGYVFTLGGAAVSWKSSKQTVITRSTMESEFVALDKCGEEAEWLRNFLEDIPKWSKPVPAICIHCDNQSAIGRALSVLYNGKSRHIRRRHNTIRHLVSTGIISIDYVPSKENIADPLTKGLSRDLVEKSSRGMGLKPLEN